MFVELGCDGDASLPRSIADDVGFDVVLVDCYADAWAVGEVELAFIELPAGV